MSYQHLLQAVFIILFAKNIMGLINPLLNINNTRAKTTLIPRVVTEDARQEFDGTTRRNLVERDNMTHYSKYTPITLRSLHLPEFSWKKSNLTKLPVFINLVINLNFMGEDIAKKLIRKIRKAGEKYKDRKQRKKRGLKINNVLLGDNTSVPKSEEFGHIFDRIKMRMALQREKRNVDLHKTEEKGRNKNSDVENHIQNILMEEIPKIAALNNEREIDVSKWIKNWKEIMAMNPILRTEKPTKPDVDFIDEWKYSYRVTLYNTGSYNVSNFVCSGILVASQWVLTSTFCILGNNITIIIGVHKLPKIISEHNNYTIVKRIRSLHENLELLQIDRPVQWKFNAPNIRSLNVDEINILLQDGKCSVLSWVPVDMENEIFELREYPQLLRSHSDVTSSSQSTPIKVTPLQYYGLCKRDLGSPVLCDGLVTGILLNVDDDCMSNMVIQLLCPTLEWITFVTREKSYYEVTAKKWEPHSSAVNWTSGIFSIFFILLIYFSTIVYM